MSIAPTQFDVTTALRGFLLNVLPGGTEIILGQGNRTAEPMAANFCVMTPIRRERLSTNVDVYVDCAFTGSASATTLTVSVMSLGAVVAGHQLLGASVVGSAVVVSQINGTPGGVGTYKLSTAQPTIVSEVMATGVFNALQPTKVCVQLDFHSANESDAADMAQTVSTLFRDEWAVDQFATSGFDVQPLTADDPKQMPFINDQDQYEWRWIVEAEVQANQVVTVSQAFFAAVNVGFIPADIFYSAA